MVNRINKEAATAHSENPPPQPYLVPKPTESPWMPSDCDHTSARTKWVAYSKQAKRSLLPQELSIQDFTLYKMRFVAASDLCREWAEFGCLGPHLAHLSTVLHIGITESVGTALSYHRIVGGKMQEKARKRPTVESDFVSIISTENFTVEEQAKKEIAIAIVADAKKNDRDGAPKGKGKKGDRHQAPRDNDRDYARGNTRDDASRDYDNRRNNDRTYDRTFERRDEANTNRGANAQQRQRPRTPPPQRRQNQQGHLNYGPNRNRNRQKQRRRGHCIQ